MQLVVFTKMFRGSSVSEIGEQAAALGFTGLDLALRGGYPVNPDNVTEELPRAVQTWKKMKLNVPMVSLETGPTDPHSPATRAAFAACGRLGIPLIKLGYWGWNPQEDYWKKFDGIRADLDVFQRLGREFGVCSVIHTHSGELYGSNASGSVQLARGFDPQHVGVYLDPSHLALDGEPWPMALAMAGDYLKAVGVKAVRYDKSREPTGPRSIARWCALEEGLVDWPQALAALKEAGRDVPFSVHGEYSEEGDFNQLRTFIRRDEAYLRSIAG